MKELTDDHLNTAGKDDHLTFEQIGRANKWFKVHLLHVFSLIEPLKDGYPPTLEEDKNHPELWKAEHWAWYCKTYIDFKNE